MQGITLIDVDGLSKLKDETLLRRAAEVPKARAIIQTHLRELMDWHEMRKHVPVLKQVKIKLQEIHGSPLFEQMAPENPLLSGRDQKIQRVLNGMASKMRRENQRGCFILKRSTSLSPDDKHQNMSKKLRIGTRESQLALWQANLREIITQSTGHRR